MSGNTRLERGPYICLCTYGVTESDLCSERINANSSRTRPNLAKPSRIREFGNRERVHPVRKKEMPDVRLSSAEFGRVQLRLRPT